MAKCHRQEVQTQRVSQASRVSAGLLDGQYSNHFHHALWMQSYQHPNAALAV